MEEIISTLQGSLVSPVGLSSTYASIGVSFHVRNIDRHLACCLTQSLDALSYMSPTHVFLRRFLWQVIRFEGVGGVGGLVGCDMQDSVML